MSYIRRPIIDEIQQTWHFVYERDPVQVHIYIFYFYYLLCMSMYRYCNNLENGKSRQGRKGISIGNTYIYLQNIDIIHIMCISMTQTHLKAVPLLRWYFIRTLDCKYSLIFSRINYVYAQHAHPYISCDYSLIQYV